MVFGFSGKKKKKKKGKKRKKEKGHKELMEKSPKEEVVEENVNVHYEREQENEKRDEGGRDKSTASSEESARSGTLRPGGLIGQSEMHVAIRDAIRRYRKNPVGLASRTQLMEPKKEYLRKKDRLATVMNTKCACKEADRSPSAGHESVDDKGRYVYQHDYYGEEERGLGVTATRSQAQGYQATTGQLGQPAAIPGQHLPPGYPPPTATILPGQRGPHSTPFEPIGEHHVKKRKERKRSRSRSRSRSRKRKKKYKKKKDKKKDKKLQEEKDSRGGGWLGGWGGWGGGGAGGGGGGAPDAEKSEEDRHNTRKEKTESKKRKRTRRSEPSESDSDSGSAAEDGDSGGESNDDSADSESGDDSNSD